MHRFGLIGIVALGLVGFGLYYLLEVKMGGMTLHRVVYWLRGNPYDQDPISHFMPPRDQDEYVANTDAIVIARVVDSEPAGVMAHDCDGYARLLPSIEALRPPCPNRMPTDTWPVQRTTLRVEEVLKDDGRVAEGKTVSLMDVPPANLPCPDRATEAGLPSQRYLFALGSADDVRTAPGLVPIDYDVVWGDLGRLDIDGLLVTTTGCRPLVVDWTYRVIPATFLAGLRAAIERGEGSP